MAGVQWTGGKFKKFEAKRQFMHCDIDERLKRSHNNTEIDKDKTHLNYSAFNLTYEQTCEKYDKRLKPIIDATIKKQLEKANGKKTLRKDAVLLVSPIVYVPNELNDAQKREFINHTFDYFQARYGENYINGYAHFDEQHTYIDPTTKKERLSQVHIHNFIVPEIDGVLNAKKSTDRAVINEVNKDFEEYTFKTFGIHYVKGEKTKTRGTVEQLKQASKKAEIELLDEKATKKANDLIRLQRADEIMTKEHEEKEREHEAFKADIAEERKQIEAQKNQEEQELSKIRDEKDAVITEKEEASKNLQEILAKNEEAKRDYEEFQKLSFVGRWWKYWKEKSEHNKLKDGLNDYAKKYNAMVREVEASRRAETRRAEQDRKIKKPLENILNRFNKYGIKSIEQFDEYTRLLEANEPEKLEKLAKDLLNDKDLQTVIEEKKNIKDEQIITRPVYEDFNLGEDR